MNWYKRAINNVPNVDWSQSDNMGVWDSSTVAKFLSVPNDEYIYELNVPLSQLAPSLVEETEGQSIREKENDENEEEARELFYEDAEAILERYKESKFYDGDLDEKWGGWLVNNYDDDDIMDLAREMLARERESWGREEMASAFGSGYPPIVVTKKQDNSFVINDGNHRVRIWMEQGYDMAPSWVNDEKARNNRSV